jgi:hypothetical protein
MLFDSRRTNHKACHCRELGFVFSHIHGRPCLPSAQFDSGKEVEIAAIHPDFCAAEPLSLMEFAGRVLISLTSFSLPV